MCLYIYILESCCVFFLFVRSFVLIFYESRGWVQLVQSPPRGLHFRRWQVFPCYFILVLFSVSPWVGYNNAMRTALYTILFVLNKFHSLRTHFFPGAENSFFDKNWRHTGNATRTLRKRGRAGTPGAPGTLPPRPSQVMRQRARLSKIENISGRPREVAPLVRFLPFVRYICGENVGQNRDPDAKNFGQLFPYPVPGRVPPAWACLIIRISG